VELACAVLEVRAALVLDVAKELGVLAVLAVVGGGDGEPANRGGNLDRWRWRGRGRRARGPRRARAGRRPGARGGERLGVRCLRRSMPGSR